MIRIILVCQANPNAESNRLLSPRIGTHNVFVPLALLTDIFV